MERWRIPIAGMTCTSCAARIAGAVRRVAGVASVRIDLADDAAIVSFDPARTSLDAIAEAVTRAGYDARSTEAVVATATAPRGFLGRIRHSRSRRPSDSDRSSDHVPGSANLGTARDDTPR